MTIRVILADDHEIVRAGLKSLLEASHTMVVVAEAENGRDTVSLARKLEPDIVVMDISMPDMNGVDATRKITQLAPGVSVLALSSHSDEKYVKGMLEAGASGYLLKNSALAELETAITNITEGRLYVSPAVTEILVGDFRQRAKGDAEVKAKGLSTREREVLQLVAEGKSSTKIGEILSLSERTVEAHRRRIMDKLSLRSIAELTKYAIREGITSLDD